MSKVAAWLKKERKPETNRWYWGWQSAYAAVYLACLVWVGQH